MGTGSEFVVLGVVGHGEVGGLPFEVAVADGDDVLPTLTFVLRVKGLHLTLDRKLLLRRPVRLLPGRIGPVIIFH